MHVVLGVVVRSWMLVGDDVLAECWWIAHLRSMRRT